jgi:2',3'-cyclic-nucleotide 2'-phosphodiesterase (5'-nucleotidase family)
MTERLSSLVVSAKRGPWNAAPLVPTLRPVVEEAASVSDMVIVLGHLAGGEAEAILRQLPQVAVVVQGHPHVAWEEPLEIDGRVAVNASGYGRDVGRLRLRYDPARRRILSYDWEVLPVIAAELTPDPEVERVVAEWEARASAMVDVPIGRATRKIGRGEMLALVKTAMRDAGGAELAYLGEGGIRDQLPEGELLARHVWNVLPFDDELVTVALSGRQVVELQDRVLEDAQISDPATLDPDRTYRLVSTGYYAARWADSGVELDWTSTGIVLRDTVIDWIKARGSVPVTGG